MLSLDERDFRVKYYSPERDRLHHVNLTLLGEDGTDKRHYICIRNMSRLVGDRTTHDGQTYVCNGCQHPFRRKDLFDNHISNCLRNAPQTVKYPDPQDKDKSTIKFTDYKKQFRLPFLPERDYVTFGSLLSQFRLSVVCLSVCLQRWCTLLKRLKLSAIFLHRCVRWPSSDLRAKLYGDSPRGTPPSRTSNARGVSKYSNFGPIEGYIS